MIKRQVFHTSTNLQFESVLRAPGDWQPQRQQFIGDLASSEEGPLFHDQLGLVDPQQLGLHDVLCGRHIAAEPGGRFKLINKHSHNIEKTC